MVANMTSRSYNMGLWGLGTDGRSTSNFGSRVIIPIYVRQKRHQMHKCKCETLFSAQTQDKLQSKSKWHWWVRVHFVCICMSACMCKLHVSTLKFMKEITKAGVKILSYYYFIFKHKLGLSLDLLFSYAPYKMKCNTAFGMMVTFAS